MGAGPKVLQLINKMPKQAIFVKTNGNALQGYWIQEAGQYRSSTELDFLFVYRYGDITWYPMAI